MEIWLILGTFPLITLPLFVWSYYSWNSPLLSLVLQIFFFSFGLSHFFSTLYVYLSSENRSYFLESKKNILIYFLIPALIFAYFGFEKSLPLKNYWAGAAIAAVVFWLTRAANFNHGTRQSFGVLQLMKQRSEYASPQFGVQAENIFLLCLATMQFETMFIGHSHFAYRNPIIWVTLTVAVFFFAIVLRNYFLISSRSWKKSALPFTYLFFQASAYAATIYDMKFFVASSAVHYVEYHFLMWARFSRFEGKRSQWSDRLLAHLSRLPFIFIGISIAVGTLYGYFGLSGGKTMLSPIGFGFAFGMVDGIFLFHYFLEAFIWKMRLPFYRQTIKLPASFSPNLRSSAESA